MTAPGFVRRWRARLGDAQANRLRVQMAAAAARNCVLEEPLADLQAVKEGSYREAREHTGCAWLASDQPCGSTPAASTRTNAGT
ncbi:hypothetical protein GTY54_07045 [Streptomyces sp. SID625]|nr:hypothetical protein [Streptomyces sp. SID625]